MALTLRGMSLRTAVIATLVDKFARKPVWSMTEDDIREARTAVYPRTRLLTGILGEIRTDVGIGYATAPARDGYEIPIRTYRPHGARGRGPLPVVMYFHGGGWVFGNVVNYDSLCTYLCDELDALVLSVDYRMAPEHPAPVAAHDCIDAARWVVGNGAQIGADPTRLAVCGDSAGGNLAAVAAQCFRDDGLDAIRHQALIYPVTDLTMSSPSIVEHADAPILTKRSMDCFADHYVPDVTKRCDPLVSPLFGDLEGLPSTLVQTADLDPIRDDGIRYAEALRAAGVEVRLTNYLGVPHGFASVPGATLIGRQHRAEIVAEMSRHLGARV
ncbi:alpha/beta hydrolase [Nostocoides sp. F2B08]|uniref:alpha/beta hydrolase n=1 Tax=Nostocoides sp. F2B08 TaxID=2653936 RepID=UPI001D051299|nr:alpha/beta hydrolase [Tetrasphaera sp. F2B08]